MTHTPGPWTIDHQRIGPPGEPVALLCDVNDSMTGTVIDWPRGNDSATAMSINDAENEANARLIAAAPDLLAALQEWTSMAVNSGLEGCDEILEQAEAAIDKATGRTRYEVQTKHDGEWSNEVGEPNTFGSEAEAEEGIADLKTLGDDWLEAEYRIREVGA